MKELLQHARRLGVRTDGRDREIAERMIASFNIGMDEPCPDSRPISEHSDSFVAGYAIECARYVAHIVRRADKQQQKRDAYPSTTRTREQAQNTDPDDEATRNAAGLNNALPPAGNAAELRDSITRWKAGKLQFSTPQERDMARAWLMQRCEQLGVPAPRLDADPESDNERQDAAALKRRSRDAYKTPPRFSRTKKDVLGGK